MVPPWRSFKRTSSWLLFGAVDFFSNTWQRLGELGVAVALYPTSDLRTMRQHCGCEGVRRRCGTYWYQADHFEGWASKLLMSAFEKVFFFGAVLDVLHFLDFLCFFPKVLGVFFAEKSQHHTARERSMTTMRWVDAPTSYTRTLGDAFSHMHRLAGRGGSPCTWMTLVMPWCCALENKL